MRRSSWFLAAVIALVLLAGCGGAGGAAPTTGRTLIAGGGDAPLATAAFSADGALLATANPDRSITIWDVATGGARRTLARGAGDVATLAFSPDGKTLASGGADRRVALWDVASGRELRALSGHSGAVAAVAFSPDGKTLASGGEDGTVRLWDVANGNQRQSLAASNGGVTSLAYSPDGRSLASGGRDAGVQLWDAGSGQLTRRLSGHKDAVGAVAFSPDSRSLASGGKDRQVKLWTVADGVEQRTLSGHAGAIDAIGFAPDGRSLATGSDDRTVKLWDAASGQARQTLVGHDAAVPAVVFTPDGASVLTGSRDNSARQWDAASGQLRRSIPVRPAVGATPVAAPPGTAVSGPPGSILLGGAAVRATVGTPNGEARFTFPGRAGRQVSVTLADSTFKEGDLRLLGPDGASLGSIYFFQPTTFFDAVTLPADGTYTLVVRALNGGTGAASLTAYDFADATGTIAPNGAAVTVAVATPGQNARLTFEGSAGRRLSVALAGMAAKEAYLTLRGPDDAVVRSAYFFQADGFFDSVTLPDDGSYTLIFDPVGTATGGATLTAYSFADVKGPITPSGPAVPVATNTPGQNVELTFTGNAGQRISVAIAELALKETNLTLIGPDGQTLRSNYFFQREGFFDAIELPDSGTYTLVFDPLGDLTGTATLRAYRVADRQGQIAIGGAAVSATIDTPGQNARLTFTGSAGQRVAVTLDPLTVAGGIVAIIGPDGQTVKNAYFFRNGGALEATLPTGGSYTLVFDPEGANTGSVTIALR